MTGILILIGSLGCLKEVKKTDMILEKCEFPNSFLPYVVGTHWNCLIEVGTTYVFSINKFYTISFFLKQILNHSHLFKEMSM